MSYRSNRHGMTTAGRVAAYATAIAVEAAAANITGAVWDVVDPIVVVRGMVQVTVAFNYDTQTAEGIVKFFKRVTYGSDTDRVELCAIRLIHGTAAGKYLYAPCNKVIAVTGEQIVAAITTAGTGGGSIAGDFQPMFAYYPAGESTPNNTNLVLAAP